MQIVIDDAGQVAMVRLSGRLDISGAQVVEMPLATLSGSKSGLVVDLSEVTTVSSIGIRHLVAAARVLARRGGRLVLLNPNNAVTEVLLTSGAGDYLQIARSEAEARAAAAPTSTTR